MKKSGYDMIYLSACAVNKIKPDLNYILHIDLEELFQICQYHSLSALVCNALESAGIYDKKFSEAKAKAIRKIILLDAEREKLCGFMEQNGIWHMNLKGIVLKEIYREIGMRQMADNDILFNSDYRKNIKEYFLSNGYGAVNYGNGNHDVYEKKPVLSFEMHISLFHEKHERKMHEYYRNIRKKLLKDENKSYGFHFSDEDFYVYMTAHEYKHYCGGGTGVRSLLDRYVYLKEKSDFMDWNYIKKECEKLKIADFERQSRELSVRIFNISAKAELSEKERQMLDFYLKSGTYGTFKNKIDMKRKKYAGKTGRNSKAGYIMSRIFPDREWYETYNPFFNKYPFLKPFFAVFRLFRGVFLKRKIILSELKAIKKL